jgi:thiol-disulfide isomerase/thioredoxin
LTHKLASGACRRLPQAKVSRVRTGLCIVAIGMGLGFAPTVWAVDSAAAPGATEAPGFHLKPWPRNKTVPTLVGMDLQGTTWNLQALRGQPVLLNFWASWCEPCRAEMPSLQALAEQQGVGQSDIKPTAGKPRNGIAATNPAPQVLTINYKESAAAAQRFVQQTQLRLPVLRDAEGAWAKQWGVSIFPSTVLIGADGKVRGTVVGELDWTSDAAQPVLRRLSRE